MLIFGSPAAQWITRFGEAEIALPVALALGLWWWLATRSLKATSSWLAPLALAVAVTTASKIAFIGWGLGIASIDFTGFSGHAMFAAAIYPMLAHGLWTHRRAAPRPHDGALALGAGYAFAGLVAFSRVRLGAHSPSEALAGYALGAAASGAALWLVGHTRQRLPALWVGGALGLWLAIMPVEAAPSQAHGMVTRLALRLSGHALPYERADLHRVPTH